MPRVNLDGYGEIYKDKQLMELLRAKKSGKGLTNATAGKKIGVCDKTFAKYLECPSLIPLGVLRKMQKKLEIPKEDLLKLIF